MSETKTTSLHYQDGTSDKVYHAHLLAKGAGFVVNFEYGRRGGPLSSGTKTANPVAYADAAKIFDKLVKEKTSKGYTTVAGAKPFTAGPDAGRASGVQCQLLNAADEDDHGEFGLETLIASDAWIAQQKFDGVRCLIEIKNGKAQGINRRGLYVPLPDGVEISVRRALDDSLVDGEMVGDRYFMFDALRLGGKDLSNLSFAKRLRLLREDRIPSLITTDFVSFASEAINAAEKRDLIENVRARGGEGIVFKRADSLYSAGRPNSGGSAIKVKFWDSITVRVAAANGSKRSVALEIKDGAGWRGVGNVTIPANAAIPNKGDIVEVRYLYAISAANNLFQPVYLGVRTDMTEADVASVKDLKVKNESRSDDEASPSPTPGM